ncbi:hypothetical protein CYY_005459 [Polysphondylium violaceum]|uniref:tRNA-splicing endonuclease subunit Sen54 N-terminal domain-containing protein n=1 Tax=Polysphondylium violaceum TaxID=133409 RepID=A0A8J4V459_9MYCE|nr:hypothetical protein CYY_005459 [Polysphondylium violaceum]
MNQQEIINKKKRDSSNSNGDSNSNDNDIEEEDESSEFRKYFKRQDFLKKRFEKENTSKHDKDTDNDNNGNGDGDDSNDNDDDTQHHNQEKLSLINDQYRMILQNHKKSSSKNQISMAHWVEKEKKFNVTLRKGKYFESMGHQVGSNLYIFIEEALFLQDLGTLELYMNQVPLSIQEAFKLLEVCELPLYKYIAYSYLKKMGYHIIRYKSINENTTNKNNSNNSNAMSKYLDNFNFKLLNNNDPWYKSISTKTFNNSDSSNSNSNSNQNNDSIISRAYHPEIIEFNDIRIEKLKERNLNTTTVVYLDRHQYPQYSRPIIDNQTVGYSFDRIERFIRSNKNINDKYNIIDPSEKKEVNNNNNDNINPNKKYKKSIVYLPEEINSNSTFTSVARKLQIFNTQSLLKDTRYQSRSIHDQQYRIDYNIYKPGGGFKKSNPGPPDMRVTISRFEDPVPSLSVISRLTQESGNSIPIEFCTVNQKDVAFLQFKENLFV